MVLSHWVQEAASVGALSNSVRRVIPARQEMELLAPLIWCDHSAPCYCSTDSGQGFGSDWSWAMFACCWVLSSKVQASALSN